MVDTASGYGEYVREDCYRDKVSTLNGRDTSCLILAFGHSFMAEDLADHRGMTKAGEGKQQRGSSDYGVTTRNLSAMIQ